MNARSILFNPNPKNLRKGNPKPKNPRKEIKSFLETNYL
jgi:hypothetical protein